MRFDPTRALIVYAGALTLAVGAMLLGLGRPRSFDTIDVRRINLRENDGTLRLVLASRDRFPGIVSHGREHPHPGRTDSAGMIFLNDEGTENGGLIFGGHKTGTHPEAFGHLSFDQYDQDQVATLEQSEHDGRRSGGFTIADRPTAPLDVTLGQRLMAMSAGERAAAIERLRADGSLGRTRLFAGKTVDGLSTVDLRDAAGATRLRLGVSPAGVATIEFLDAGGNVTRTIRG